jgi:hypothetical protein
MYKLMMKMKKLLMETITIIVTKIKEKESKYDWNRDKITLETVIPEIPKKSE